MRGKLILPFLLVFHFSLSLAGKIFLPNPDGFGPPIEASDEPPTDNGENFASVDDIHFYLWTKSNRVTPDELFVGDVSSIDNSHFIPGAHLKFLVHGFGADIERYFPKETREVYVSDEYPDDINVILVDWAILADDSNYFQAVANCQLLSQHTAQFFKFLVDNGYADWDNMHVIGFSLGGQAVGQIGHKVQQLGGLIERITSLDPALPLFDVAAPENRTSPEDAKWVDVIHTAANGALAMFDAMGHIDFYPNGGRYQPGCGTDLVGSCAHSRAAHMWKESITTGVGFWGRECPSWENFEIGTCDENPTQVMGHPTPYGSTGIYFLRSNAQSPYAQGPL